MNLAYDSTKRTKAFGCYTGCPCAVGLAHAVKTDDPKFSDETFHDQVQELIAAWKGACDGFRQGSDGGPMVNWNKKIKLPYGKFHH